VPEYGRDLPHHFEGGVHLLGNRAARLLDTPEQAGEVGRGIGQGWRLEFDIIFFHGRVELNLGVHAVHEDLLLLDERALRDDNLEVTLDDRLAGKAGALCKFLVREKPPVFLAVELDFPGLDVHYALAALSLAAADHVHVDAGPLRGIENRCPAFCLDLAVTGKEGNGAHGYGFHSW